MERIHRLIGLLAAATLTFALPMAAAAQTAPKPPELPRFDVAASVIWLGADTAGLSGDIYRTWDATGGVELNAGFYWTENVKLSVDAGSSADRELFGAIQYRITPTLSHYVYVTHRVSSRWVTPTVQYQFLHNTWVHPYVGGGVDVDWERRRADSDDRGFVAAPPGVVASSDPGDAIARRTSVRAVLLTGAKFYVSPRVFARTDLRVSFTDQIDALRWGAGVGVDF